MKRATYILLLTTYFFTDQIRRSSRSVSGNIAEAWRKRIYPKSFVAKLNDAEGEAAVDSGER